MERNDTQDILVLHRYMMWSVSDSHCFCAPIFRLRIDHYALLCLPHLHTKWHAVRPCTLQLCLGRLWMETLTSLVLGCWYDLSIPEHLLSLYLLFVAAERPCHAHKARPPTLTAGGQQTWQASASCLQSESAPSHASHLYDNPVICRLLAVRRLVPTCCRQSCVRCACTILTWVAMPKSQFVMCTNLECCMSGSITLAPC